MPVAPKRQERERAERDEMGDSEVPAAVVCARCGEAECAGCFLDPLRSGVVALVPWERPGTGAWNRLWATARATTFDAERFFESLPDGSLAPAVQFAVVCELVAATAMTIAGVVPIVLLAPGWARRVVVNDAPVALRVVLLGVPLVAALLVAAHAAHGWALDAGARRVARGARRRALRFGLYAAGWDLIVGPLGAAVVAFRDGAGAALSIVGIAVGLPRLSAQAFLRGCYRLEGADALPALRASYIVVAIAILVGAGLVIAVVAALGFGS